LKSHHRDAFLLQRNSKNVPRDLSDLKFLFTKSTYHRISE